MALWCWLGKHEWSKDCEKCLLCGSVRKDAHIWRACKCSSCGTTRNDFHDWSNDCEKCAICGAVRKNGHVWKNAKCLACGAGIGYDCFFYSKGTCRVGDGNSPCSLGTGKYWTDCYVYGGTGLKGKYDKEKGEENRRRAHLKRCKRCQVSLEVAEDLDFRYAIREFSSERDFRVASEACARFVRCLRH
jgi:hypothetical protein